MSHTVSGTLTAYTSATLEAAGALNTTSPGLDTLGYHRADFFCTYTRGAAGGSVAVIFEFSLDGENFFQQSYVANQVGFVAGTDYRANAQRYEVLYTSTATGAETFVLSIDDIYAVKVRIRAKEVGVTGTPGTFAATCRFTNV